MAAKAAQTSSPMALRLGWIRLWRVAIPLSIWLPLTIFVLARIYGLVIIALAARYQVALPSPDHPGIYLSLIHI